MRRFHDVPWLLLLVLSYPTMAPALAATPAGSTEAAREMLFFRWAGSWSVPGSGEIAILSDGSVRCTYQRQEGIARTRSFHLNSDELSALGVAVEAADFYGQPANDTGYASHSAERFLRITMGGRTRELALRAELRILSMYVLKVVNQVAVLDALEEREDIHAARTAISDHAGALSVLQPSVLVSPLKRLVSTTNSHEKLSLAAEALAWLLPPDEWMGFLAGDLERGDETHRFALLGALAYGPSGYSSLSAQTHQRAVVPLFVAHLRREYPQWGNLSVEQRKALGHVVAFLGLLRHYEAVPVLVEMVPALYRDSEFDLRHGSTSRLSMVLPRMGEAIIGPMVALLDSADAGVRASAAEVLGRTPGHTPSEIAKWAVPRQLAALKRVATPRLDALSRNDPEGSVREAAADALERIRKAEAAPPTPGTPR